MFKYLRTTIGSTGDIREKSSMENKTFCANKKLLKSNLIVKKSKTSIYKILFRPVLLYSAATMSRIKNNEEGFIIVERKLLRTILGSIKITKEEYKIRRNDEMKQEQKLCTAESGGKVNMVSRYWNAFALLHH